MPDIIDLISSDPEIPINLPHHAPQPNQIPRRPSRLGLISSDPIDDSLFTYDNFDIHPKKRRVSHEQRSPHGRVASAATPPEPAFPSSFPSIQFSDDDFALPSSRPAAPRTLAESTKQAEPNVDNYDPFVLTSPLPARRSKKMSPTLRTRAYAPPSRSRTLDPPDIITIDEDDDQFAKNTGGKGSNRLTQDSIDEFSDPFSIPGFADIVGTGTTSKPVFSSKTAALLSSLSAKDKATNGQSVSKTGNQTTKIGMRTGFNLSDEIDEPAPPQRAAKKTSKMTNEEKEAKAQARAEVKAQKDREKELEKERKLKLKEEKAKQKQVEADISEVNKLKVDKKESTPEMIINIASSLESASVGTQTIEFMKRLGVDHSFFDSPIPNLVRWRRKVKANYNEAAGHWEPCVPYIAEEKHILCLVPAQDFVDMVISSPDEERETLEHHFLRIRSAYPDHKPIYLIEGLTAWMRKNRNSRNRAYQAEVLRQYEQPAPEPTTGRGRGRKPKNKPETTPPVDDDTIEDALLTLQVTHSCLIYHSNTPAESAEWIKNYTEHISTIPYRREMMTGNDAAFCMDVGQVKSGEDNLDTFVKMLQEINRITASMSYGIAGQYPCVTDLVRAMRMHGPTMLEDVRKSANKNGALTDSRVGPAASKRLYKVFTGLDPTSTDV